MRNPNNRGWTVLVNPKWRKDIFFLGIPRELECQHACYVEMD